MSFIFTPYPHFVNKDESQPGKHIDISDHDLIDLYKENPELASWGYLGHEGTEQDIAILRRTYEELSHWSDLALCIAWGRYTSTVYFKTWTRPEPDEKDELFLNFCCWEQLQGEWNSLDDVELLKQVTIWKNIPVNRKKENTKKAFWIIGKIVGFFFKALLKIIEFALLSHQKQKIEDSDRSEFEKSEAMKSLRRRADKAGAMDYDSSFWHQEKNKPRL